MDIYKYVNRVGILITLNATFLLSSLLSANDDITQNIIHHQLSVSYQPSEHRVNVTDTITFPKKINNGFIDFKLHSNLEVTSKVSGVSIDVIESDVSAVDKGIDQEKFDNAAPVPITAYRLKFDKNYKGSKDSISLHYEGVIHHNIKQIGEEYSRGFSQSPGLIDERGVYLAGSTYWIPSFSDEYITYDLAVVSPEGWQVVSQGKRVQSAEQSDEHIDQWQVTTPTEEIYLIAAQFTEYSFDVGAVKAMAFLRTPDEALANKYLETTAQYMEMYRNLVGPYPYSKFALIENFWETGYGMPSFTLLGEKIIRFPFILHSSYPHELLHNWWGNSVYIDFDTGNWCEGLTAYMADHLIAEQRGNGSAYRRSTLQGYTDYVDESSDFALNKFIARSSPASSSIGYGKSAMMWDMLRAKVGDDNFRKSFQRFYRDNKYQRAGYSDIQKAFEKTTGTALDAFFDQWTTRKGAPELVLSSVKVNEIAKQYQLDFTLNQIQSEASFKLDIPLVIYTENGIVEHRVIMNQKEQSYVLTLDYKPTKVHVDAQFNLFRKLHYSEIPPSLSKIFGADKVTMILPSAASEAELRRYKKLAELWSSDKDHFKLVLDDEIKQLPSDNAIWLFGWNNRFRNVIESELTSLDAAIEDDLVTLGKASLSRKDNSFVIGVRHPDNPKSVVVWLTAHDKDAVAGLARKLPHYGKYSYLAFTGKEPSNVAKGQWPTVNSPLVQKLSDEINDEKLKKRSALAKLAPVFSSDRMQQTLEYLASDAMKGRGLGTSELDTAADYIAEQFKHAGLLPLGDNDSYYQDFVALAGKENKKVFAKNVLGYIPGSNKEWSEESVIISAHYDHLGLGWPNVSKGNEGKIHHGADDNASGVAVLIELAQILKTMKPKRSIIFAAFSGEEAGLLGSKYYVKNMKKFPVSKIMGVVNMDTVGRLGDKKLLVLNGSSAREWKFIFMGSSFVTGIKTEVVTQDIDSSDQVSFINENVPGVQLFAGSSKDYHKPTDRSDEIDYAGLVKVATIAREVLVYLSERPDPMPFIGTSSSKSLKSTPKTRTTRKVSTGVMPDFAFSGKGVLVASVSDNSPAAKAGLKKGDVIILFSDEQISDLKSYSVALKKHEAGDSVEVVYLRNKVRNKATITLKGR